MSIWEYARLALAVGLVAANVFVWWGVSLENENFSQETKDRGWRMLVRALAAEALLAFLLVVVDTKISIDQKQEIAALERAAGPRNLTGDEVFKLIDTLKPLGGKPYDLTIPPMMESGSFLDNQLVSILKDSGWELRTIKGNVEKAQIPFGLWMFAGNPPDKVSQEDL